MTENKPFEIFGDKHPLIWAIEALGMITAATFTFTGIFNGLAFFFVWRLNYFMIASPSDVIMSGFIAVSAAGALIAFVGGAAWLYDWMLRIAGKVIGGDLPWLPKIARAHLIRRLLKWSAEQVAAVIPNTVVMVVLAFVVWSFVDDGHHRMRWPSWYSTGLTVAEESTIRAPCRGSSVAWLGSEAAVLECKDGAFVIHDLDQLVTKASVVALRKPKRVSVFDKIFKMAVDFVHGQGLHYPANMQISDL